MSGSNVWLSEVTCLKEVVWLECEGNIKDPGQSSWYTPFPTKRAVRLGAWMLTELSVHFGPTPHSHESFWPPWSISSERDLYSNELESNPLGPHGCYSEPKLHQIPLQGVEGSSAGRSSPLEDPSSSSALPYSASPVSGVTIATSLFLYLYTMHVFPLYK